jgi:hypothetical protein
MCPRRFQRTYVCFLGNRWRHQSRCREMQIMFFWQSFVQGFGDTIPRVGSLGMNHNKSSGRFARRWPGRSWKRQQERQILLSATFSLFFSGAQLRSSVLTSLQIPLDMNHLSLCVFILVLRLVFFFRGRWANMVPVLGFCWKTGDAKCLTILVAWLLDWLIVV